MKTKQSNTEMQHTPRRKKLVPLNVLFDENSVERQYNGEGVFRLTFVFKSFEDARATREILKKQIKEMQDHIDEARAAIAKAEGKQA